jgi:hypothetical protein
MLEDAFVSSGIAVKWADIGESAVLLPDDIPD